MERAFSPCFVRIENLGRCPRLVWPAPLARKSAFGACARPRKRAVCLRRRGPHSMGAPALDGKRARRSARCNAPFVGAHSRETLGARGSARGNAPSDTSLGQRPRSAMRTTQGLKARPITPPLPDRTDGRLVPHVAFIEGNAVLHEARSQLLLIRADPVVLFLFVDVVDQSGRVCGRYREDPVPALPRESR